jgi:hypothetical protein
MGGGENVEAPAVDICVKIYTAFPNKDSLTWLIVKRIYGKFSGIGGDNLYGKSGGRRYVEMEGNMA